MEDIINGSSTALPQPPTIFSDLPKEDEMRYFIDAYFETWHPLYPFMHEEMFQELLGSVPSYSHHEEASGNQSHQRSMDLSQLFLVLALGSKVLESRFSTDFNSDSLYTTAMFHVGRTQLHDSIRGIQVMLLLVLGSFSFPNGLNAWFLVSTILASCLDIGLQRKFVEGGLSCPFFTLMEETRFVNFGGELTDLRDRENSPNTRRRNRWTTQT